MTDTLFSELGLSPELGRAIEEMGFETATPVQAEAIPLIRTGVDVIAKSQTGTGKTVAFSIPALEQIDPAQQAVQVLILCPTRELAQQAGVELGKLTKYMPKICVAEVYGGSDMQRQRIRLKKANLVVGTPGRVMDHMERGTLRLDELKMVILDEADEMLEMGFKEDMETILQDVPDSRQTVLFSATMPPAILALTKQFQKDPQMVEIDKGQVTIANTAQSFVEVPSGRKMDALNLLLRYHQPNRAIVFCNTKKMVDELGEYLDTHGFAAERLHGDMKQAQRTSVMNAFKRGKVSILIATDVAARGIDVNDLDFVFNFDIPVKTEYYVHRIGRTGRAGKSGTSITLCSGKRQATIMRGIARMVKAEIAQESLPTAAQIASRENEHNLAALVTILEGEIAPEYTEMAAKLTEQGYGPEQIAAAVLQLHFPHSRSLPEVYIASSAAAAVPGKKRPGPVSAFADLMINIGRNSGAEAKHFVGAITERAGLSSREVGKIDVFDDQSVVGVPADRADEVIAAMQGCKICGQRVETVRLAHLSGRRPARSEKPSSKAAHFAEARIAKRETGKVKKDPVRRKKTEA